MSCPEKSHPATIFVVNFIIVLFVFLLWDAAVYGWLCPGINPLLQDVGHKLLCNFFMAIGFSVIYNKASITWAPKSELKIFFRKEVPKPDHDCSPTVSKIVNGMAFSALVSIVVYTSILLSGLFISYIFISILHGAHGDLDVRAVNTGGKLLLAGIALELAGKTEDDPKM